MDARETIEKAKKDLAQLRDELKLKVHLAKKDAESTWKDLEPRIAQLEKQLDQAAQGATDKAAAGLQDMKAKWPSVSAAIDKVVSDVKKGANDLKAEVDKSTAGQRVEAEVKKGAKDLEEAALDVKNTVEGFAKKLFK